MNLLITQSEIEALPEEPRERFVAMEEICRERFYAQTEGQEDWNIVQDWQLRYMTTVVAAAKHFSIKPISEMEVPKRSDFNNDAYRDFVAELQFYVTQLMLEGAERNSRASIVLRGLARDRVVTLLSHARDQVRKLELPQSRIDHLLRLLDEFEKQLEKPRLHLVTLAVLALGIAGAISDLGGAAGTVRQLINQIEEIVGLEKEEQDKEAASRWVRHEPTKQLEPPRRPEEKPSRPLAEEMDDEIPF